MVSARLKGEEPNANQPKANILEIALWIADVPLHVCDTCDDSLKHVAHNSWALPRWQAGGVQVLRHSRLEAQACQMANKNNGRSVTSFRRKRALAKSRKPSADCRQPHVEDGTSAEYGERLNQSWKKEHASGISEHEASGLLVVFLQQGNKLTLLNKCGLNMFESFEQQWPSSSNTLQTG